jgi:hypothetical protein
MRCGRPSEMAFSRDMASKWGFAEATQRPSSGAVSTRPEFKQL